MKTQLIHPNGRLIRRILQACNYLKNTTCSRVIKEWSIAEWQWFQNFNIMIILGCGPKSTNLTSLMEQNRIAALLQWHKQLYWMRNIVSLSIWEKVVTMKKAFIVDNDNLSKLHRQFYELTKRGTKISNDNIVWLQNISVKGDQLNW